MNYGFGFTNNNFGETVTVFTTSGGQSGSGFTGATAGFHNDYMRLISEIGQGPGCALGNCCESCHGYDNAGMNCGWGGNRFGTIVDIPYDKVVAYVHNAVSGW
jgi:hypothetical protein